jgi:predicted ATPase
MIRRISIQGYKSLTKLEVRLQPLSVLFGPNAVGKSNFLDALQLLSRMVNVRTLKEAFDPPYRGTPLESFTFGVEGIPGHLKQESLSFTLEADVHLSDQTIVNVESQIAEMRKGKDASAVPPGRYVKERLLRYRVTIEILPKSGVLRVADEFLAALKENGELRGSRNPFLEKKQNRLSLRLEGQAHPTYHEIGLDNTVVSRPLYPPHYPHIVALRQELSSWFCFYFEPRERMRAANPVKEVKHIGMMGEELAAFLNTLRVTEPQQFSAVEKALHTLIPRISGIESEPNNLGEIELRLKEDNVPIPARLVSEGTLRILGLLAVGAAKGAPTLVAFEEPENGIHPRRIELVARFLETQTNLGTTQYIVTTHSPILPDLLPNESLFVCRRRGGRTVIEPFLEEAGELFRKTQIRSDLDEPTEPEAKVSEKIMRGDFDA